MRWAVLIASMLLERPVAQIDPMYAVNLTVFHEYPPAYASTDLSNQDTGDVRGDMYFVLRQLLMPIECTSMDSERSHDCYNPEATSGSNVISQHVVEVDSRFGDYGHCNLVLGSYHCFCSTSFPPLPCTDHVVGREDVRTHAAHKTPNASSSQWMWWRVNIARKVGGFWYSTLAGGRCDAAAGKPCYWREIRMVRRITSSCILQRLAAAVAAQRSDCFGECPQPKNMSSPCCVECLMLALMGPDSGRRLVDSTEGISPALLDGAWLAAFASNDISSGGCPDAAAAENPLQEATTVNRRIIV